MPRLAVFCYWFCEKSGLASRTGRFGRYQCEAAIQSVHAQRAVTGRTNLEALGMLYRMLAAYHPTAGVLVAQASVLLESGEAPAALVALDDIPMAGKIHYQPYWVIRSRVLAAVGEAAGAQEALDIAIGMTEDGSVREYLASSHHASPALRR